MGKETENSNFVVSLFDRKIDDVRDDLSNVIESNQEIHKSYLSNFRSFTKVLGDKNSLSVNDLKPLIILLEQLVKNQYDIISGNKSISQQLEKMDRLKEWEYTVYVNKDTDIIDSVIAKQIK